MRSWDPLLMRLARLPAEVVMLVPRRPEDDQLCPCGSSPEDLERRSNDVGRLGRRIRPNGSLIPVFQVFGALGRIVPALEVRAGIASFSGAGVKHKRQGWEVAMVMKMEGDSGRR